MKPWVKAGLLGGALQIIFTLPILLIYILPLGIGALLSLCVCSFFFLLYPLPGVLGAYWLPAPRTANQGVVTGGLAGLLATSLDSVFTLLMVLIISLSGLNERYIEQVLPNGMQIFEQSGLSFWLSTGGQLLQAGISLIFHIMTGVFLSVVGAVIYVSIKKE